MNLFSVACDHSNTPRGSVGGRTPIQSRVILDSPVPVIAFTCRGMYVQNFAKTKTDLGNSEVFETIDVKDSFISQPGSLFAIARKLREEPLFFAAVLRRSSPVRKTRLRFWGRSPRLDFC